MDVVRKYTVNTCHYSVQNLLSFCLLSNIQNYIVSLGFCRCESCSSLLREECMLRVLLYLCNKPTNAHQLNTFY